MRQYRLIHCIVLGLCFAGPQLAMSVDRPAGEPWSTRSVVMATNGMAATSQPLATDIALNILKAGGSAVDAAIAANAALGLMEPTGNGIGGDLFAIYYDAKSKKLYGLNASGRSPAALNRAVFQKLKELSRGQPCDITGIRDYRMIDECGGIQWPYPESWTVQHEHMERAARACGSAREDEPSKSAAPTRLEVAHRKAAPIILVFFMFAS